MDKRLVFGFVWLFCLIATASAACNDNICDCKISPTSASACDVFPGISAVNTIRNTINTQIDAAKTQLNAINDKLKGVQASLSGVVEKTGNFFKESPSSFAKQVETLVSIISNIGSDEKNVINSVQSTITNVPKVLPMKDITYKFESSTKELAKYLGTWLVKQILAPRTGVPCLLDSFNNGSIYFYFNTGFPDLSLSIGLDFKGIETLRCMTSAQAILASDLKKSFDENLPFVKAQAGLIQAADALAKAISAAASVSDISNSPLCKSNATLSVPEVNSKDYPWVKELSSTLSALNQELGENGFIGSIYFTLRKAVCQAKTVDNLKQFSSDLSSYVRKVRFAEVGGVVVDGLFNSVKKASQGVEKLLNSSTALPFGLGCMIEHLVSGRLHIRLTLSIAASILPPWVSVNFGTGFSCQNYLFGCTNCLFKALNETATLFFRDSFEFNYKNVFTSS
eukprot:TRINITY_DN8410_c0_g1_i1.p1 TRINITY_DN8410_c0_g1~~TRINITY_DN8410_c0_g1_i1.p1  ORF type:complete len:468 (-),score=132.89 TRINITY_DN8410_c0_g1_i1:4-1362(-)